MDSDRKPTEKKPYTTPQLFKYGDVSEITRTTANSGGVADSVTHGNKTA